MIGEFANDGAGSRACGHTEVGNVAAWRAQGTDPQQNPKPVGEHMIRSSRARSRWQVPVGASVALALLVGACGGGGDDDASEGTDGPATSANEQLIEPTGEVTPGGDVIFALEAETTGWDPTLDRWAVSGHQVGQTVFDQLATFNTDSEVEPYLAESFTPNDDYTEWTITLRPDITFHDGSPLTSEAVVALIENHLASPLTAPAIRPIEAVEAVDELNATVTLSTPWASFPVVFTAQVGYVPAPSQYESGDQARRDTPIGTGPFVFESWTVDNEFVATKNEDYWRQDAAGNPLPYLDKITYRPIIESQQRLAALQSGDINMFHTTDPEVIIDVREGADNGEFQIKEDGALGEESFIMLNTIEPPLDDLRVREALALATDRETYAQVVDKGIRPIASTPFVEGSPWFSQEAVDAYPAYDPAAAQVLVDEYEAENGPIQIEVGLTPSAANREATGFLGQQWAEVGIEVNFKETEQGEFINLALAGLYQADQWRQFGSTDPDGEFVWWDIENANEINTAALNFARIRSEELTAAMQTGRESDTFEARKAAYDEAQVILNEELPYIWLTHTIWAVAADPTVRNIGYATLPDGDEGLGFGTGFAGAIRMTEVWVDEG